MNNPLNELSAVYQQNIAESCECEDKKKELKKTPEGGDGGAPNDGKNLLGLPGNTPMGGSGARVKRSKMAVEPLASTEGYEPGDVDQKVGAVTSIPKKDQDAAKKRLLAKAKAKRAMKKEDLHISWRDELREVAGYDVANKENATTTKPQNSDDSRKEVTEKKVKNKVKINPPQGVTEGFQEIGGVVVEMYEITEKIDLKKADMGDVIKDFRKSDAPQFKGKSDKKIQQMAIAAKLEADEGYDMKNAPSIKDAKPAKKTPVKYYPGLGIAPTIKTEKFEPPYEELKTFKNEKEKRARLQQTRDHDDKMSGKMASESASNPFQVHFDKDGKEQTNKGSKRAVDRIKKNIASNRKSGPMAQDPYKSRAGDSD